MPIIDATFVLRSRARRHCGVCMSPISLNHNYVSMFGYAEPGDPPYRVPVCMPCARAGQAPQMVAAVATTGRADGPEKG